MSTPGTLPNIESAWDQILRQQLKKKVESAISHYESFMSSIIDSMPFDVSDLNSRHQKGQEEAIRQFKEGTISIQNAEMKDIAFSELQVFKNSS